MPIVVNNTEYTDEFGNVTSFYRANAGDRFTVKYEIASIIRISSVGNPLVLDSSLNTVTSSGVLWEEEGFRPGYTVEITIRTNGGSILYQWQAQINFIDGLVCDFSTITAWPSLTNGEQIDFVALDGGNVRSRSDIELFFNHIKNSTPSTDSSLIDGEATRFIMTGGIESMTVGQTINAVAVGNQSGQFVESAKITRNAQQADSWFNHDIEVTFTNSGMYDQDWFFGAEALKNNLRLLWSPEPGDVGSRSELKYAKESNTGFFDEPHNISVADSTLVQGVSSLDYCSPSTFNIIVDGPLTDIGIGSAYRSINPNYYKNKLDPQQKITMLVPTQDASTPTTYNSFQNSDGAGYDLTINSINTVATQHTINVTFTPNAAFTTFMTDAESGDRAFYIWVKCGNINHLAFSSELECAPPVAGPLVMEQDYGYLDHSENIETPIGNNTGFIADTEDDCAYIGTFKLEKNKVYDSFSVKIEAYNSVTDEDFTLQEVFFGFNSVPYSAAGVHLLNESIVTVPELPTTSVKRETKLTLEPSLDTPTEYGVKIYAPWLLNWRHWLPQSNASVDFYPTQNQDWEQYDNVANWEIRTELSLVEDGVAYQHSNTIIVEPYDNESNIDSTIEVFTHPTPTLISVIPEGDTVKIKATHVNLIGNWDQSITWGMITVEPEESSPRWICSSVVPFDNNTNNPLLPLSGLVISIQYPSPNTAVLECTFNTNLIDMTNGVKITSKIKEGGTLCPGMLFEHGNCIIFEHGNNLVKE